MLRAAIIHLKTAIYFRVLWIVLTGLLSNGALAEEDSSAWILVDTQNLTLTVHSSHNQLLARFHNISIGSRGPAEMHLAGDETTPLGTFYVTWANTHSPFQTFYGFDYPNPSYARRAYDLGILSKEDHDAIISAYRRGERPPQETPLGGYLGIHGLGEGDPYIHRNFNWTNGCIALTNADLKKLAKWIRIGTRVVVR